MKRRLTSMLLACSTLTALSLAVSASAQYRFTSIDVLGASDVTVYGISNSGLVTGIYTNPFTDNVSSFLWQQGAVTSVDAPAGTAPTGTYLQKANTAGLITANLGGDDDFSTPAIYDSVRGTWTYLPRDPAGNAGTALFSKLTDTGLAAGHYYTLDLSDPNHFLGPLVGHSVVRDGHAYSHFDVPGATSTLGYDINDAGQIIGEFDDADDSYHAFLKDGSVFTELRAPGAEITVAYGINEAGDVVGRYRKAVAPRNPGGPPNERAAQNAR